MLEDDVARGAEIFEEDVRSRMIELLDKDISELKKRLRNLERESEDLSGHLNGLDSELTELLQEQETLQAKESAESPIRSDFFSYVNSEEAREVQQRARLESCKRFEAELSHQINRYRQKNKRLAATVQTLSDSMAGYDQSCADLTNLRTELRAQIQARETETRLVIADCDRLKQELIQRSDDLRMAHADTHAEQRALFAAKTEELAKWKSDSRQRKVEYSAVVRDAQARIAAKKAELERMRKPGSWQTERAAQLDKLKKLRTTLLSEQRTKELAAKRDAEIANRLIALTKSKDGDSETIRKIVMAEISGAKNNEDTSVIQNDIESEQEYGLQLDKELRLAEKSLAEFEKFKDDGLKELALELDQCEKRGYLEMLREDLALLQAEVVKYL
jgi:prefoldin subunit 5